MASKYWIKLYHEILHDPKMGRLPDNVWRRAIELFLLAGELDEDGKLPETGEIAWLLRQPDEEQLEAELTRLEKVGILTRLDDGWLVTKFADRQAATNSTDRVKEFRKRQRAEQFSDNGVKQEQPKDETQSGGDETKNETFRSTDIDTDKEEREEHAPARVDYAQHVMEAQAQVSTHTESNPEDQYFEYRDEFLKIYQEMTGSYPDFVVKGEVKKLIDDGVKAEAWREAWRQCKIKWGGNGKVPLDRVIEVARMGGDYELWRRTKFPDTNGRDSPPPPKPKLKITAIQTGEQIDVG